MCRNPIDPSVYRGEHNFQSLINIGKYTDFFTYSRKIIAGRAGGGTVVQGLTCSQNVTGPSLTSATFMSAPNTPVSTCASFVLACETK